jgi:hypothetical protein
MKTLKEKEEEKKKTRERERERENLPMCAAVLNLSAIYKL